MADYLKLRSVYTIQRNDYTCRNVFRSFLRLWRLSHIHTTKLLFTESVSRSCVHAHFNERKCKNNHNTSLSYQSLCPTTSCCLTDSQCHSSQDLFHIKRGVSTLDSPTFSTTWTSPTRHPHSTSKVSFATRSHLRKKPNTTTPNHVSNPRCIIPRCKYPSWPHSSPSLPHMSKQS